MQKNNDVNVIARSVIVIAIIGSISIFSLKNPDFVKGLINNKLNVNGIVDEDDEFTEVIFTNASEDTTAQKTEETVSDTTTTALERKNVGSSDTGIPVQELYMTDSSGYTTEVESQVISTGEHLTDSICLYENSYTMRSRVAFSLVDEEVQKLQIEKIGISEKGVNTEYKIKIYTISKENKVNVLFDQSINKLSDAIRNKTLTVPKESCYLVIEASAEAGGLKGVLFEVFVC